jgi:hypothetical protein
LKAKFSTPRKKLIEVSIPLEAINAASAQDNSIRHSHPVYPVVGAASAGCVPCGARAACRRSVDRRRTGRRAQAAQCVKHALDAIVVASSRMIGTARL